MEAVLEEPRTGLMGLLDKGYSKIKGIFQGYDTSTADYDERSQDSQYKFRERTEKDIPNPKEPAEHLEALADNNKKLGDFVSENGFDMHGYVGSDVFYEREQLLQEKLLRKIVRDMNADVDKAYVSAVKNIKIKDYALEKANYIAKRVGEFAVEVGQSKPEIAMYMLTEMSDVREGNIVTTDVYVAHEQVVTPAHCDITPAGSMRSVRDIKRQRKRIVGWAHSHSDFNTFFSPEDDSTFVGGYNGNGLINKWAIKKNVDNDLIPDDVKYEFFQAFVVNARGDEPAYRVAGHKPRFYIEDGVVKSKMEVVDLERTISNSGTNNWPIPEIIKTGKYELDKELIDKEIIRRVIFSDGTRLSDHIDPGNLSYEKPVTETLDDIEKYFDDPASEEIKLELPDEELSIELPSEVATEIDDDLTARITALEAENASLKTENTKLKKDYKTVFEENDRLKEQTATLESDYFKEIERNVELERKVAYLNAQPVDRKRSYTSNITDYYSNLMQSDNKEENLLGTISKIMAGHYRGNLNAIKNGEYQEIEGETRIWKWEHRLEAIKEIYEKNIDNLVSVNSGLVERLKEILNSNRYLKKNHSDKLDTILGMLDHSPPS